MENAEEIFHFLEDFSKRKPKTIPQELNDYLAYVARTGDPVYQWSLVKCLFKEKLLNVITDFYETSPGIDIPPYPNVDPFNYDTLKNSLIERLDSFTSAPFTVQRICELLTYPRKQYNRVDKYMRAIEKNILVVSTREPGTHRHADAENGEPIVNGSDNNSEYNVDVEMEDISWKETKVHLQNSEPQPSSSESYSIAEIEARLRAKQGFATVTAEKPADSLTQQTEQPASTENVADSEKPSNSTTEAVPSTSDTPKMEIISETEKTDKMDIDVKAEEPESQPMTIPEIKIDDTSSEESPTEITKEEIKPDKNEDEISEDKSIAEKPQPDETKVEPETKEPEIESKLITEVSEVSSSSEESSSSSDNTDGNSNSPKTVTDDHMDDKESSEETKVEMEKPEPTVEPICEVVEKPTPEVLQSDNYSITDVNSELPQTPTNNDSESQESVEDKTETPTEEKESDEKKTETEPKPETDDSKNYKLLFS
ncbi:uncharacterized protein [Epargyreus clarus]|uniref:uncharacterized protein n=1 Tax=Epargyreus clarus TaxID=520877 RepID=UPI003C2E555B